MFQTYSGMVKSLFFAAAIMHTCIICVVYVGGLIVFYPRAINQSIKKIVKWPKWCKLLQGPL